MRIQASKELFDRAQKSLAGGVASQVRSFALPHPVYFDHGQGSKLYDVDGNEYIDYLLAYGPLILGHCPEPVVDAVRKQAGRGSTFGAPHETLVELAEKLIELVPCYEMVRFNNSGSEAVQAVLRLARAFSGRSKIVKFEGHYHGWYDNIYISHLPEALSMIGLERAPWAVLGSAGQPESVLEDIIVLPWNDLEVVERTLKQHAHEIAAIITEPIMSNCGIIPPAAGYLEGLRRLTHEYDVLLIFDEVITGLRTGLHSAQGYFSVTPDLAIIGKALGAGYPILSWGGRMEIMQLIAQRQVIHAGTFNGNPVCAAAALATLTELSRDDGAVYERMTALTNTLKKGIAERAEAYDIPVRLQGIGPFFALSFRDPQVPITNFREALEEYPGRYPRFRLALLERGVHTFPTEKGLWYLSTTHTKQDITQTLDSVDEALAMLKK